MFPSVCPGCATAAPSPIVLQRPGLDLVRCVSCGLVHLLDWDGGFHHGLYDYYSTRLGWSSERLYPEVNSVRHRDLLAHFESMTRGRKLLDVGCGMGQFVKTAIGEGWTARGIDLADGAIEICKRFHIPCTRSDFFGPDLDGERYDVITMFELVEHLSDPHAFMRRAASLLTDGGIVYVTTPNFRSASRRLLGPEWVALDAQHICYFEPSTLSRLLGRHFHTVTIATRGSMVLASPQLVLRRCVQPARDPATLLESRQKQRQRAASVRTQLHERDFLNRAKAIVDGVVRRTTYGDTLVAIAAGRV